ncbi:MAG: T9SS type A sorting domain-containing protein [Bacteroidia bacterium]
MKEQLLHREIFSNKETRHFTSINTGKFSGILGIALIALFSFFTVQINAQGTWTAVANTAPDLSGGVMLLLSDGTVIAKTESGGTDGIGSLWNKLTPDIHGSYVSGTWSSIAAMHNTRLYFSSQILKDGRVYVAGGEYGTGGSLGETYDPLTNVWTNNAAIGQTVSDANSEILPDGRVLQALVTGNLKGTTIYNPATNTYGSGPTCVGIHNECAWVKLADNSVLMVDRNTTNSERYIPSLNQWVADGTVPVALYDPWGLETGGAVLLPDGRAFFIGSLANTAYYTPSGNSSPGTWAAGPTIPGSHGAPDAAAAMMVNGKVLCALSPVPTSGNHFPTPTSFYEFDYVSNSFTQVNAPGGGLTRNISCYEANMLDLPDGSVLYSEQNNDQYYIYTPGGTPLAAGKPTINNISSIGCNNLYTITGTKFNGISQGATYGDDWQMSTNYPVIRLTSGTNVYYARTFNWNSTGVQRGASPDTAQFTLPAGLPAGTYSLVVTANGISSNPVSFTPGVQPSATITPGGFTTFCMGGSVVLNAPSGANLTYQWKKGGANINGATASSYTVSNGGNFKVTVTNTASGCTKITAGSTVVTVNALPAATLTPQGPTTFCAGGSLVLAGNTGTGLTYKWKKGANYISGASQSNYTVTLGGNYRVQITNSYSCSKTSAKVSVSVPCRNSENESESGFSVKVYPNPSSGDFTFDLQNASEANSSINIFDITGRLIAFETVSNPQFTIRNSKLGKGIYSAVITNGTQVKMLKLVKTE